MKIRAMFTKLGKALDKTFSYLNIEKPSDNSQSNLF